VLAGLHGHLGSGQAGEVSTALQVLLALTHSHAALLLDHADFVSALLDCLDNFTQAQLHQVRTSSFQGSAKTAECLSLCMHTRPAQYPARHVIWPFCLSKLQ